MMNQPKTRIGAHDFLELPETNTPTELIDGEVIVSPTPVPEHQRLVIRLLDLVRDLVPDGEVFVAPLSVYLDDDNVPEPDVMWVAENSRCKVTDRWLEGPPDLIVEVLSPGTARADKTVKYLLYERHGVREYWLVDGAKRTIEAWTLREAHFALIGTFGIDEPFESPLLNAVVDLRALFP